MLTSMRSRTAIPSRSRYAVIKSAWFDQFPPTPDGWTHDQWCWRHWAPCPVFGANGIGASLELVQIFVDEISHGGDAAAMNAQMYAAGRLCCTLGDERMYEIWGHWPPDAQETQV
jgi:hypothetical protein